MTNKFKKFAFAALIILLSLSISLSSCQQIAKVDDAINKKITETFSCLDGTPYGQCSETYFSAYCSNGKLLNDPARCGCPEGRILQKNECITSCNDGTANNTCSQTKPYFCDSGILIKKASLCSCSSGFKVSEEDCVGSDLRLQKLKIEMLNTINKDRADYGIPPVILGDNNASQKHAEEMLKYRYLAHFNLAGEKPYIRYSQEQGKGAVSQNVAYSGFFYEEKRAKKLDIPQSLKELEYEMMYNDSEFEWGHRDNILDPIHNKVNIGIAYDDKNLAIVQDFEKDYINWETPITYDSEEDSGNLRMKGQLSEGNFSALSIYYDPIPERMTKEQLLKTRSYGLGSLAGYITNYPYYYENVSYVYAKEWRVRKKDFAISADIKNLTKNQGIYTAVIWGSIKNKDVVLTTVSFTVD